MGHPRLWWFGRGPRGGGLGCGGESSGFVQGQVFVDEGDGHAAFAYARGDALDGAVADVAGAENAGQVGFEGEGFAVQGPGGEITAGADVALGVALKRGRKPGGLSGGADHEEECVGIAGYGSLFAVRTARCGDDLLKVVFTVDADDLGPGLDADVGFVGDLVDEVLRHAVFDAGTADEQDDLCRVAGEEKGSLAGRVAAADEEDSLAGDAVGLVAAGAVEDATALQLLHAGELHAVPVDAGGEQDGAGVEEVAAVELDAVALFGFDDGFDAALDEDFGAELLGLLESALGELVAGDAGGEAEVVFDAGGGPSLAAGGEALDEQDAEAFGGAIDGRGHAGGAGAGDDDVVPIVFGDGLVAEGFGDFADGGVQERLAAVDLDAELGLFGLVEGGTPVVLDAVGGEEAADGVAVGVVPGADDVDAGGGGGAGHLLRQLGAAGHGGEDDLSGGGGVADELLKLLALKARGAARREGADGDDVGGAHEDGGFAGELACDGAADGAVLADDVLEDLKLAFENDEEARFFAFAGEPVAGNEVDVGGLAGEALALGFFDAGKEGNLG